MVKSRMIFFHVQEIACFFLNLVVCLTRNQENLLTYHRLKETQDGSALGKR